MSKWDGGLDLDILLFLDGYWILDCPLRICAFP